MPYKSSIITGITILSSIIVSYIPTVHCQGGKIRGGVKPSSEDLPPGVGHFPLRRSNTSSSSSSTTPTSAATENRQLNVYGWPDRRSFADPQGWPGRVVGKLEFPDREYCTGTLVGPSLVLTARHCFADTTDKMVPDRMGGTFMAGYHHGEAIREAGLLHVWYGQDPGSDWAIVRIDEPIGWDLGHLVISPEDIRYIVPYVDAFSLTAYSKDKYEYQAGTDPMCSLLSYQKEARLVVTSCSGEAGASGGAIINAQSQILAVFVAAIDQDSMPKVKVLGPFDHRYPNFATPATEFFPTWSWLITQPEPQ